MHKLLEDRPGSKLWLLGNEAIARGAVEAGVSFASTYPGTPSSEISLNLFQISRQTDLYFEYSTNEKVALEVAAAAAISGVRSMCMMKHVGLNVAADTLMTLAYIGVQGALVILTADDPFMFSSQNEQDNRYYGKLSGLPVIEPSSVADAHEMMPYAFELSQKLGQPVIFRTTTRINHSSAAVALGPIAPVNPNGQFKKNPFHYVCVPAVSRQLHVRLLEKLEQARQEAEICSYNTTSGDGQWGIVCNGVSFGYVADAVANLNIASQVRILRLAIAQPLPYERVNQFLAACNRVLVVEEGEPFMEEAIRASAQAAGLTLPIKGKSAELFSQLYEFDPIMVQQKIAAYFGCDYTPKKQPDLSNLPTVPPRPPTLCAGCSHRAVFYAVNKATAGMETIKPSDIGCYTLGFMPPLAAGDFVVCMGSSTGSAGGFSQVTGKKIISFIGDSTFFHSGISGLINAVFNNHDLTLVILDNRTTAMTGHQPNPGVDMQELAMPGYGQIDIEPVVRALGVGHVTVIKPFHVKKSIQQIREAVAFKGVSVIIAREKCTLYARMLKQLKGRAFYVNPEKCVNHRNCIDELACPAFYLENKRIKIDPDICTGCAVCAQVCPENAILPLKS